MHPSDRSPPPCGAIACVLGALVVFVACSSGFEDPTSSAAKSAGSSGAAAAPPGSSGAAAAPPGSSGAAAPSGSSGSSGSSGVPAPPSGGGSSSSGTSGDIVIPTAPGVVPREFSCDPSAVTADTLLMPVPSSTEQLLLRPSGTACAHHLVFHSADADHVVSDTPAMIVLATTALVGPSRVVCWSSERHSQVAGGGSLDRYSDGVQLECALRSGTTWAPAVAIVQATTDWAAWVIATEPDAAAADEFVVHWLRDSKFQFLHLSPDNRPADDAVYTTRIRVAGAELVVVSTTKVGGSIFETASLLPTP